MVDILPRMAERDGICRNLREVLVYHHEARRSPLDRFIVRIHIIRMQTIIKTAGADRIELGFKAALLIREINARLTAVIAAELADTGLTLPQITLIKALAHGKELTITELARELSTGKPTVVGIVDRLERAGLVERLRGGEDRRKVRIAFSPDARERVLAIKATVDGSFSKAFESVPAQELAAFDASLEKVLATLEGVGASKEKRAAADAAASDPKGD